LKHAELIEVVPSLDGLVDQHHLARVSLSMSWIAIHRSGSTSG
jgi:hypothetical protein